MPESPISPHLATPAELKERLALEREGQPFLAYRDEAGSQRLTRLPRAREITIGRDSDTDVSLEWDQHVSGLHAELRRAGGEWLVVDDGLSRNGTFVNEERVVGRRRLRDRDQVRVGRTVLVFRDPIARPRRSTAVASEAESHPELSPAQRRVLVSLCRPFHEGDAFARPPTNQQIADELFLSVAAVKTHLRLLFQRFGVEDLPHNEKRARLARLALESGAVSSADLRPLA
jgi:pSer/pThr/pTyr-binding forkhead associated (FHA) protein